MYLGIDSAGTYLALALWSPERGSVARYCEEVGREHASRLLGELEALLKEAGVQRKDLHGIGVGVGPGSYTGLRVGIAAAQGLARGLGVPLSGGDSLSAIAYAQAEGRVLVALDARRGNVYAGLFVREGEGVRLEGEITKVAREGLLERYPDVPYYENAAPDATLLAMRAAQTPQTVKPLYL